MNLSKYRHPLLCIALIVQTFVVFRANRLTDKWRNVAEKLDQALEEQHTNYHANMISCARVAYSDGLEYFFECIHVECVTNGDDVTVKIHSLDNPTNAFAFSNTSNKINAIFFPK